MQHRGLIGIVVSLGFGLAAGCGGGSDASPVPAEDYFDEAFQLTCERAFECCTAAELDAQFGLFDPPPTNVEECVAAYAGFAALIEPDFLASIEAGRTSYDADKAGTCFDAARGLGCDADPDAALPDCTDIVTPQVAEGGECAQTEDCIGEATCVIPDGETLGACTARAAVGEACVYPVECVEAAYCDFTNEMCVARKANGEACTGASECTSDYCDTTSGECADEAPTCVGA